MLLLHVTNDLVVGRESRQVGEDRVELGSADEKMVWERVDWYRVLFEPSVGFNPTCMMIENCSVFDENTVDG